MATSGWHYGRMSVAPATQQPEPDVEITPELARVLLRSQAPQWAELPLEPLAEGWDNTMLRLGDKLAVRLPRRASASQQVRAEAQWAEEAGWGLSLPIPVPQFLGEPEPDFPYPWTVTQFFPGQTAAQLSQQHRDAYAEQLAGFLVGFHRLAPLNAPENTVRGVAVSLRMERWTAALERVPRAHRGSLARAQELAAAARPWGLPARWIHGDPHPANLIAEARGDGARLLAAVDLSDLTSGDPASDLGIALAQFSPEGAQRFRSAYGRGAFWADADLWERAGGWRANFLALMCGDSGRLGAIAREALAR